MLKWSSLVLFCAVALTVLQVLAVRWINPPFSAFMLWERLTTDGPLRLNLDWTPASGLSANLASAVLASEDQRFYEHNGIDWAEVKKAVADSRDGDRLRGASTISMQTARNLFLWSGRSWVRKGLEVYYTMLLELFLPKNRILEIYLNVAEWGPGVYGAPAAARKFFGRPPSSLTRDQAARLAVVLPSPKNRSPLKLSSNAARRYNFVRRQMAYIRLEGWGG